MWRLMAKTTALFALGVFGGSFIPTPPVSVATPQPVSEIHKAYPYLTSVSSMPVSGSPVVMTEDDINARFVGILAHTKWLVDQKKDTGVENEIARINRQIDSLMDDVSDDYSDLRDDLESQELSDDVVIPDYLLSSGQVDEYCLTYEGTGETWEWQTCGSGSGLATTSIDTSTEIASILTDETGSGNLVFSASPTFTGTVNASAVTLTSALTFSGSAANIALGSNYLSGDGDDEGIYVGSTGNVGIGTTTLGRRLVVDGQIGSTGNVYFGEGTASPDLVARISNSTGNTLKLHSGSGGVFIGSENSTPVNLRVNNTDYLTITTAGNVGIGTTTPARKFVVSGSGSGVAGFDSTGVAHSVIQFTNSSVSRGYVGYISSGDNGMGFLNAAGTVANLLVTNSGNVGIGDTTPDYLLDVAGTAGFDGDLTMTGNNANIILGSNYLSGDGQDEGIFITSSGNVGIGTTTPDVELVVNGDFSILGGIYDNNSTRGNIGEILQTNGSGVEWVATSTLGVSASFANSAQLAALLSDETGSGNAVFSASPTLTGTADFEAGDFSSTLTLSGIAANIALGSNWLSGDGDDEGIYVSSTGNVGVGTTTPGGILHVAGSDPDVIFEREGFWKLHFLSTDGEPEIYTEDTGLSGGNLTFQQSSAGGVGIGGESGTAKLYVSGNVGIGTTTPQAKLEINASSWTHLVQADTAGGTVKNFFGMRSPAASATSYGLWAINRDPNTGLFGDINLSTADIALESASGASRIRFSTANANNTAATERMRIDGSGNVGIGTTTPNQKLSIFANGSDSAIEFSTVSGAKEKWTIGIDDSDAAKFKISSSSALGTSDRLVINGSGYVGIGNSNPAFALDVLVNDGSKAAAYFYNSSGSGEGIRLGVNNANNALPNLRVFNSSGDIWAVTNAGNTIMGASYITYPPANRLNVNGAVGIGANYLTTTAPTNGLIIEGNVGIGTTTPSEELTISGDIMISDSTDATIKFIKTNATTKQYNLGSNNDGAFEITDITAGNLTRFYLTTTGNVGVGNFFASEVPKAKLDVVGSLAVGYATSDSFTAPSNGVVISGNVGIGTTSPYAKLSVTNTGTIPSFLVEDSISPDSTPFVIDSGGQVGIGTASPGATLDVSAATGYVRTTSTTGTNRAMFLAANTGGNFYMGINDSVGTGMIGTGGIAYAGILNISSVRALQLGTSDVARLTIESGGDVGIGTTTPNSKLHVAGMGNFGYIESGTNFDALQFTGGSLGGGTEQSFIFEVADTGISGLATKNLVLRGNNGSSDISISPSTGAPGLLTLKAAGLVGIGTASPDSLLEVSGNSSPQIKVTDANNSIEGIFQSNDGSGGIVQIGTVTNHSLRLISNNTGQVEILANGSMGIGTTTPAQKLQVYGNIRIGTAGGNGCVEDFAGTLLLGTCSSDENLKDNIEPIATEGRSYLESLAALTPVTYTWNETAGELYKKDTNFENLGLIAQEVEEEFPELVSYNEEGYRQVNFTAFPFYIIEALKEVWNRLQGHDERLDQLEQENEYLKERIEDIENELDLNAVPPSTPETPIEEVDSPDVQEENPEPEPTPEETPPVE